MKFLADENVENPIAETLKGAGHDVLHMAELAKRTKDEQLLKRANEESRIFLTNDKDFGELIFLQKKVSTGIILMRFRTEKSKIKADYMKSLLENYGERLRNSFTVVKESHVRIRKLSQ